MENNSDYDEETLMVDLMMENDDNSSNIVQESNEEHSSPSSAAGSSSANSAAGPSSAAGSSLANSAAGPGGIIPSPVCGSIAGVKPRQQYEHYDHDYMDDKGVEWVIYKPVGPFSVEVPVEDVKQILELSQQGPVWKRSDNSARAHERSQKFHRWMTSIVPTHLQLAFDQPFQLPFPEEKKRACGRRRKHNFLIGYGGYCCAKSDGCKTTLIGKRNKL